MRNELVFHGHGKYINKQLKGNFGKLLVPLRTFPENVTKRSPPKAPGRGSAAPPAPGIPTCCVKRKDGADRIRPKETKREGGDGSYPPGPPPAPRQPPGAPGPAPERVPCAAPARPSGRPDPPKVWRGGAGVRRGLAPRQKERGAALRLTLEGSGAEGTPPASVLLLLLLLLPSPGPAVTAGRAHPARPRRGSAPRG